MERKTLGTWMMIAGVILLLYSRNSSAPTVQFNDESIFIKSSVMNELKNNYAESVTEEAYCLEGTYKYGVLTINNLSRPKVYQATPDSITYDSDACKDDLGTLHFHPQPTGMDCSPSRQDVYSFGFRAAQYPGMKIHIVLCNLSYFVFKVPSNGETISINSLKIVEV
jgi:hypothetical protein